MRPGHDMAYPLCPPPALVAAGLSAQSLLTQLASVFLLLSTKLAISLKNIFTFFDKLEETLKLKASGCHVKSSLPPPHPTPHSRLNYKELCTSGLNYSRGSVTCQVLFSLPRVAGFPWPRSLQLLFKTIY